MAIYRVQGPDGKVHRIEGPDGAAPEEIEAFAAQSIPKGKTWEEKVQFERGKLQEDQLKEMPWYERARAGMGKSFADVGTGLKQLALEGSDLVTGNDRGARARKDVAEERHLSDPLMSDAAGVTGNIAGTLIQSLLVPGGSTLKGAALTGGAMAAAQPVATGESRTLNTAIGTGFGALGHGVAKGIGKALSGPKNVLTDAERALAAKALEQGIDLSPAQLTGNKFLQAVDATLEKMPATAGNAAERKAAQGAQFTRAVTRQMGEDADNIGEAVMSGAKDRLGKEYERIFSKSAVELSPDVALPKLSGIIDDALTALPKEKAAVVSRQVDAILGKVDDAGMLSGKSYQKWRSGVRSADGDINHYLKQVKSVIDEAAQASLGRDAMGALKTTNAQYKAMKTIEPLAAKSTTGHVPPGLLMERVRMANPNMAYGGAGEMGDLAKIGKAFIKDQVPDSGTAQRAMAQMLLSGGMGAGAYGATGDPEMALKAGAGTALATMALPRGAQALLARPEIMAYLTKGGLLQGAKVDPRMIELLLKGSAGLPVSTWAALSQ